MNITNKRRAKIIHEILAEIINNIIKNDQIGYINVTNVDLSNDLSFSSVYYTILNDKIDNISLSTKILEKNKSIIRKKLAEQIRNMKKIPFLIFKYDNSLNYGKKIEKLLEQI
ncbi:MAG: 30S ribosome-binding factor RbfA [Vigna little leaf phytoplasma]|nr:30S ribosome-binding factor RbfA [Vigna little leaf phytoplasma]